MEVVVIAALIMLVLLFLKVPVFASVLQEQLHTSL